MINIYAYNKQASMRLTDDVLSWRFPLTKCFFFFKSQQQMLQYFKQNKQSQVGAQCQVAARVQFVQNLTFIVF